MNKKYTVITGASSGIGAASAKKLVENGHNVIMVARRTERLNSLKEEFGRINDKVDIVVIAQDLSKIQELIPFYHELNQQYDINIWVNNAGFDQTGPVTSLKPEVVENMISTNIEAVALLSTLFAKDHKNEVAQLVNVGSLTGYMIWPGDILYSATKHFVTAFTEGLSNELKSENARLQAKLLSPRRTETEFELVALGHSVNYADTTGGYNTSDEMAEFLWELLNSKASIGYVNEEYKLELLDHKLMD